MTAKINTLKCGVNVARKDQDQENAQSDATVAREHGDENEDGANQFEKSRGVNQRDPHRQFVPIQKALSADVLNEYIVHVSSGLFACPPGLGPNEYWGQALFA